MFKSINRFFRSLSASFLPLDISDKENVKTKSNTKKTHAQRKPATTNQRPLTTQQKEDHVPSMTAAVLYTTSEDTGSPASTPVSASDNTPASTPVSTPDSTPASFSCGDTGGGGCM